MRNTALIVAVAVSLWAPFSVRADPPVWTAVRGRSRLVLFGSMHLLPEGATWAPAELISAERRARYLWFEIPINVASDAAAAREALAKGSALPGETLWSLLTPVSAQRVRRAALAMGVAPESLTPLRPWLADITLSLRADLVAGAKSSAGVERQVQAAVPLTVERRSLETAAEQIRLLADAPLADQIASLRATADEILDRPDTFAKLLREWMSGDLSAVRRDALDPLEKASPALFERLITHRNRRWALLLRREAPAGLSLVIVGMGHMIGPEGLPALLSEAGWKVSRAGFGDHARAKLN